MSGNAVKSKQSPTKATSIKIIVLGSSNAGKSSLIERYVTDNFRSERRATVGSDFSSKRIRINDNDIILQIWDTAGMEKFHQGTLGSLFYRGAHGALLVYDVNDDQSMDQLVSWRDELLNKIEPDETFPIIVVGNKVDLKEEFIKTSAQISYGTKVASQRNHPAMKQLDTLETDELDTVMTPLDVIQWCFDNGYGHIETSAKDGRCVDDAMTTLAALAYENQKSKTWVDSTSTSSDNIIIKDLYAPKKDSWACCS